MTAVDPRIIISDGKTIIRTIPLESKNEKIKTNLLKVATTLNEIKNEGFNNYF